MSFDLHGIGISWTGLACATRCRYCRESSGDRPLVRVSYERARDIASRFARWAHVNQPSIRVSFEIGHCYNLELAKLLDFLRFPTKHGGHVWDRLPLNGLRLRSDSELTELLSAVKEAGIEAIDVAFYGVGEAHDSWAGRAGDYDYLMRMARAAADIGLMRDENIVLRKSTLRQLPDLLAASDAIPGLIGREPNLMDYLGRGRSVDHERLELDDLPQLPKSLRERIDRTVARSESEWVTAIESDSLSLNAKKHCLIVITDDNANRLEREDCATVVSTILAEDSRRRDSEPTITELALRYGDRQNRGVYAFRDLMWKWRGARYIETTGAIPDWLDWRSSTVITRWTPG